MLPEIGDRVRHPQWGTGVVLKRLAFKAARVAFDETPSLPRTLRLSDLTPEFSEPKQEPEPEPVSTPVATPEPDPEPEEAKEPEPNRAELALQALFGAEDLRVSDDAPVTAFASCLHADDAWQTLEALRLGVVPAVGVRDYTVARDEEMASIGRLFDEQHGCRVLWGDYGCGKTHMLEATEQLALESGFATARITLDPRENALHHPLRLYRKIANSMRTLQQVDSGLNWLFEQLVDSPDHYSSGGAQTSRFFSPLLRTMRCGSPVQADMLSNYVHGERVFIDEVNSTASYCGWRGERMLAMSDFRTYGRMYTHLVGTLACWFADAGLRGLVLLFDEVERVDALTMEDQDYALEVLKHYAAVTMQAEDLAFDPEDLYRGGQSVHRELPLRFRGEQPLCTVFALTPLEQIREHFAGITPNHDYDISLSPLGVNLLRGLVERIAGLYGRAYPEHNLEPAVCDLARRDIARGYDGGHDTFRDAVRSGVLLFDADRLGTLAREHE